jgi:branched-chain amino acid transport system substrate-binding protein
MKKDHTMASNSFVNTLVNTISFALLSVLLVTAFEKNNLIAAESAPIIIAHVSPTTGRFALHAEADRRGVVMAIDEVNAKGGVLGRQIVLVSRNPTLDTVHAAKVADDLITKNRIGFMVGAINSGVAASMSLVCQKYGVIFINTNSSAPAQSTKDAHRVKFVFDANAANYNKTLLKYALDKSDSKRVLLLVENNNWGRSSADASKPYIKDYGGKVVQEILVSPALPDPAGLMKKIKDIEADVVAVNISGNNQVKLFAHIDPQIFKKQSWIIGEVDWEDIYPSPGIPRPLFGVNWSWNLDTPGTKEFVAKYRKRYANTRLGYPGHVTYSAYLATKALLEAIQKAGTTDNHAVIKQLESYRAGAEERMQHTAAYMDPVSHHLQQSTYIATWRPDNDHPERSIEILGHISPDVSRYAEESNTKLESFEATPRYVP